MTTRSEILSERLTKVSERLALYYAAETAILGGAQSYSIGNRTLTRADLKAIADRIKTLEKQEMKLINGGAIRLQRVLPRNA